MRAWIWRRETLHNVAVAAFNAFLAAEAGYVVYKLAAWIWATGSVAGLLPIGLAVLAIAVWGERQS